MGTYKSQSVLVTLDQAAVEALNGLDGGLRSLGDLDLDVGGGENLGALLQHRQRSVSTSRMTLKRVKDGRKQATHIAEQLDAVPDAVHAASLKELLHSDGLRRVDKTSVDPVLQAVEVEGGHLLVEAVAREGGRSESESVSLLLPGSWGRSSGGIKR